MKNQHSRWELSMLFDELRRMADKSTRVKHFVPETNRRKRNEALFGYVCQQETLMYSSSVGDVWYNDKDLFWNFMKNVSVDFLHTLYMVLQ